MKLSNGTRMKPPPMPRKPERKPVELPMSRVKINVVKSMTVAIMLNRLINYKLINYK